MPIQLLDGTGQGNVAKVNDENELEVRAITEPLQSHRSKVFGDSYQVIGDFASLNNSTHTVLHIVNTSTTKSMIVTYMRMQIIGAAGGNFNANTYFQIGRDRTVSSGGTAVTPVNVNFDSGNTADATCTDNNPTMTGTFLEIDRWYPEGNGKMVTFNKEGSVILGLNDTLEIRCVTDHTSGTAYARVSFIYE